MNMGLLPLRETWFSLFRKGLFSICNKKRGKNEKNQALCTWIDRQTSRTKHCPFKGEQWVWWCHSSGHICLFIPSRTLLFVQQCERQIFPTHLVYIFKEIDMNNSAHLSHLSLYRCICVCTVFHATLFPKFTMKCGHVKEFFSLRELSYGFGVGYFLMDAMRGEWFSVPVNFYGMREDGVAIWRTMDYSVVKMFFET